MMRRHLPFAALLACALALGGCSRYEPLSLHGAGSMRVEVEVYKGPLSKPVVGQVGELVAVLTESIYALDGWERQADAQLISMGCHPQTNAVPTADDRRDCAALVSAYDSAGDALGFACELATSDTVKAYFGRTVWLPVGTCTRRSERIANLRRHSTSRSRASTYSQDVGECTTTAELRCLNLVVTTSINNLAMIMQGSASRAADGNVRFVPRRREVRSLLTSFGHIANEFGNQLQSRANAIKRQMPNEEGEMREARLLPMGDYLRGSGNTDFIQLYDWLNATADGGVGGFPRGRLDPPERIRMAQRLTSDYYWQKVNEVYTSGQGDVSMAFIKDELGNWDLKSFSNDPSELLRSYRRVTNAALKTASRLASGGQVSEATRAAGLANQLATGEVETPAPAGELGLPALRDRISARLAAERARYSTRATALSNEIQKHKDDLATQEAKKKDLDQRIANGETNLIAERDATVSKIDDLRVAKLAAEKRKADLPHDAMAVVNQIMDDHLATVAAIQQSVAGPPTPSP